MKIFMSFARHGFALPRCWSKWFNVDCVDLFLIDSASRGDRGWLSHGLIVTLPISYSLDGGTLWGFTRDMRFAD